MGYNEVMKQLERLPRSSSLNNCTQSQEEKVAQMKSSNGEFFHFVMVFVLVVVDTGAVDDVVDHHNLRHQLMPFLWHACTVKKIPVQMLTSSVMSSLCESSGVFRGGNEEKKTVNSLLAPLPRFLMVQVSSSDSNGGEEARFIANYLQQKFVLLDNRTNFSVYSPPVVLPVEKVPHAKSKVQSENKK